jgi:hypothetical protein
LEVKTTLYAAKVLSLMRWALPNCQKSPFVGRTPAANGLGAENAQG